MKGVGGGWKGRGLGDKKDISKVCGKAVCVRKMEFWYSDFL